MAADDEWRTWRAAMADALYGERGFYRRTGAPAAHFRTAAHASPLWATAWAALAETVAAQVDAMTLVEVGAGGGELLSGLAAMVPQEWRLVGVDVCPRPASLPSRVTWAETVPHDFEGLLIAVEWLDVVPLDVVERTDGGLRYIEVAVDGAERLGGRVEASDERWLGRWWPLAEVGDRGEVGHPRDRAWADAVERMARGVAVAVDYGAEPLRDVAGTLTGYRDGRQTSPVPDGRSDITAHVLMPACAAAATGVQTQLLTQREALRLLGVTGSRPPYAGNPRDYLRALQATGEAAELLDPGGLGAFTWLVQARGVPLPFDV